MAFKPTKISMSLSGTDEQGVEKHVRINITDPEACAELGAGGDGEMLADVASFAADVLDHNPDGGLIDLTVNNAAEILGATGSAVSQADGASAD